MPFKKFVQIGGIAFIAQGPYAGKIAAIVNVVDQNRLLIDGPCSDVPRHVINIKHIHLTKFRVFFPYTARTRTVRKALEAANINEKWADTNWAKKIELKAKRASLSDYDRFTAMMLKRKRRSIIRHEMFLIRQSKRKAADKKMKVAPGMKRPKKVRRPRPKTASKKKKEVKSS